MPRKRKLPEGMYQRGRRHHADSYAGVALPMLTRFVKGERSLTLATAEMVCNALGYHLEKDKPPPARKKARGNLGRG
jgi:hypothetical protein